MNWVDFWNGRPAIYSGERHKHLHYQQVARDFARMLGPRGVAVLDYGCGEALYAGEIARRCERLILSDAADTVREGLTTRFGRVANITVAAPGELDGMLADASLDAVVVNSLLQYLDAGDRDEVLALARAKLKPDGRLIVADVVPEEGSALRDAAALLRFAWAGGFLASALGGLARTTLSGYRKLRDDLGFATYSEASFLRVLHAAGFEGRRVRPNFGHNQARMTFVAQPRPEA